MSISDEKDHLGITPDPQGPAGHSLDVCGVKGKKIANKSCHVCFSGEKKSPPSPGLTPGIVPGVKNEWILITWAFATHFGTIPTFTFSSITKQNLETTMVNMFYKRQ